MKTLLLYFLLVLISLSKQGSCQKQDEYYNDDKDDLDEDDDYNNEDMEAYASGEIVSESKHLVVEKGSNVFFPCRVEPKGGAMVEWYFERTRLFLDDVPLTEDIRYNRTNDGLTIMNVNPSDTGNYSCTLVEEKKSLNHTLGVNSNASSSAPAQIVEFYATTDGPKDQNRGHYIWRKGTRQKIVCKTIGFPRPSVVIQHMMMHGKHHQTEEVSENPVTFDPVERTQAGKYICIASNELFRAEKSIQVDVEFAPEIHVKKDYVNTAEGVATELVCKVQAHPPPHVVWEKNGQIMKHPSKKIEVSDGMEHKLEIIKTHKADFGQYTCVASNHLGSANRSIRLSGEPTRPVIQKATFAEDAITPVLIWKITSQTPITEYLLEYKKQENNDWEELVKSAEANELDNVYTAIHKFDDLEEGTYHARIRAKNNYGWSELSAEKIFSGNKVSLPRAANTYSQLESINNNSGTEIRISLLFVTSLLVAHLLH